MPIVYDLDYTSLLDIFLVIVAMTESVNLSSRLENIGRIFGININQIGQLNSVEDLFKQATTLQFKAGKHQDAIALYDRALKFNPKFWQAWLLRGIALCQLREFKQAVTSFDKVLEIQPNPTATVAALNGQTLAFTELRRYKDAIVAHKKALEIKPAESATVANPQRSS